MNGNISNEELIRFLGNEELQKIFKEYQEASNKIVSAGFNVFTMTSDVFHRENYHSDIIKAFLDPEEEHGEGTKFLDIFIEMLNSAKCKNGKLLEDNVEKIEKSNYSHASVLREPERIDILIKGDRNCIIIENKINDARDMDRQLPRYYEVMSKCKNGDDDFEVDAIVYLTKSPSYPSDKDWTDRDRTNIYPRLINISIDGRLGEENSLIQSWISPCIDESSSLDCISILRQYSKLLKSLIPTAQKEKAMNDFLKFIYGDSDRLSQAKAIPEMLIELPSQMAESLQEDVNKRYRSQFEWAKFHPWPVWGIGNKTICVVNLIEEYSIFVYCVAEKECAYTVCLKNFRGDILEEEAFNGIQDMTRDKSQQRFYKTFGFYDKEKVVGFIGSLLEKTEHIFDEK